MPEAPRRILHVAAFPPGSRGGMETHAAAFSEDFGRQTQTWSVLSLEPTDPTVWGRGEPIAPDCVFVEHWSWTDLAPPLRAAWPGVPVVACSGGSDVHHALAQARDRRDPDAYRRWLDGLRRSVDLVINPCVFSARRMADSDLAFLRFVVVRGGSYVVQGCRRGSSSRPRIVVAARLIELKGVDDCLAVVANVQRGRDAEIVIAGDGPERETLERAAGEMLAPGTFTFLGAVDPVAALATIADADVFLAMPRLVRERVGDESYDHVESMGRAICEAVCNGVPVVSAGVGGVPESVPPGVGTLVAERDIEAAAREVVAWLDRGPPAPEAVAAERAALEWPAVFARYDDLLTGLCRRMSPGR